MKNEAKKISALILSADAQVQRTIRQALPAESYRVEFVFTSLDLLQMLLRREFDLVVNTNSTR